MTNFSASPLDLRDVVKSLGWQLVPDISPDLYIFNNDKYPHRQIYFPKHNNVPDYYESVHLTIEKLSSLHDLQIDDVVRRIGTLRSDSVRYRISTARDEDFTLPLSFAAGFIEAAELALLASACSAIRPITHHKRLAFTEATQLVRHSRLGQTEKGSFIFNISCPLESPQGALDLAPSVSGPLGREAMIITYESVNSLVAALETDTLDHLIDETKASDAPVISSNFCDALTRMHDPELGNDVELTMQWSPTLPLPQSIVGSPTIRIQRDYFKRIEEVKQELRTPEKSREELFVGTVEVLNGEMGADGYRQGEVIIAVMLDDTVVRARAFLDIEQYAKAVECHTHDGHHVAIWGRILPGRQPRSLVDIVYFETLPAPPRK